MTPFVYDIANECFLEILLLSMIYISSIDKEQHIIFHLDLDDVCIFIGLNLSLRLDILDKEKKTHRFRNMPHASIGAEAGIFQYIPHSKNDWWFSVLHMYTIFSTCTLNVQIYVLAFI
ncbi:hypothetical protein ACJX0J_030037 [Zea mays]